MCQPAGNFMPRLPTMTLEELFPEDDYRFQMWFERGDLADFFARSARSETVLAERRRWLCTDPKTYAAILPPGEAMLDEAVELACEWNGFAPPGLTTAWQKCLALGGVW